MNNSSQFNSLFTKRGFTKLISKKTLIDPSKGYVVDDCCVFGAEVFVIKKSSMLEITNDKFCYIC